MDLSYSVSILVLLEWSSEDDIPDGWGRVLAFGFNPCSIGMVF